MYVRPSYDRVHLIDADQGNIPYLNVGDAIAAVPDGGSARIYLYYKETFYLTSDNSQILNDGNSGWNIGTRKLSFYPYGQDDFIQKAEQAIKDKQSNLTPYFFNELVRPTINIPTGYNSATQANTHGTIGGSFIQEMVLPITGKGKVTVEKYSFLAFDEDIKPLNAVNINGRYLLNDSGFFVGI